jgi:vacuolar-type H+-ATPase subunit H
MNARRSTLPAPAALLEAIRQAETEASRRLAAEREAIAIRLAAARREAEARVAAAEQDGRLEGERRRQAAHCRAEREAAEMVARAQQQAAALRLAGTAALPDAVALALAFILESDHAP